MNKITHLLIGLVFLIATTMVSAGEKAPQKVIDLANTGLALLGTDTVIVRAVRAQNAERKTPAQIQGRDRQWIAAPGVTDFMRGLMTSVCGRHLRRFQRSTPYFAEIFVMDNQGALVAITNKTTDYWQGDEAKFIRAYNNGAGAVYVSEVAFDESTRTDLVHISVPVVDNRKTIGVVTLGVAVDKVE